MRSLKKLAISDRAEVLVRVGFKLLRGVFKRSFLREYHGILLIGKHVTLFHASHIRCGKNCKFEDYSEIQGLDSDGIDFGDNVTIDRGTMIRPSSFYGIDLGFGLTMGNGSSIEPHGYIGCSGPIMIGENVMIGPKCSLFAENHIFDNSAVEIKKRGVSRRGIRISDNYWIRSNVAILDGVTIGDGCVIGAGTLVSKDVNVNSVVMNKRNRTTRNRTIG